MNRQESNSAFFSRKRTRINFDVLLKEDRESPLKKECNSPKTEGYETDLRTPQWRERDEPVLERKLVLPKVSTLGTPKLARNIKESVYLQQEKCIRKKGLRMSSVDALNQIFRNCPEALHLHGKNEDFLNNFFSDERMQLVKSIYLTRSRVRSWHFLAGKVPNLLALDLSFSNLCQKVPEEFESETIQTLLLKYNSFNCLPRNLAQFSCLTTLDLRGNQICIFNGKVLQTLVHLEYFNLEQNEIIALDSNLSRLRKLKGLILKQNQLDTLALFEHSRSTSESFEQDQNSKKRSSKFELQLKSSQQRHQLAELGLSEWMYFVNSDTASIDFENAITGVVVRGEIPPELDKFARLAELRELVLSFNNLTDLPSSFRNLKNLEVLNVAHNKLLKLRGDIFRGMVMLRVLHAEENQIPTIPHELKFLKKLEILGLDGNHLEEVPDSIGNLENLRKLHLRRNPIKDLNPVVVELKKLEVVTFALRSDFKNILAECAERRKVHMLGHPPRLKRKLGSGIHGERIVFEPAFRRELARKFKDAQSSGILRLHFMGLQRLPEQITRMSNLRELHLSAQSSLKALPPTLTWLQSLHVLNCSANAIELLPEELQFWKSFEFLRVLKLSDNRIKQVPASLAALRRLEDLDLSGNRINMIADGAFTGMSRLKSLRAESNLLKALPSSIKELSSLADLFLTWNKLEDLPSQLGSEMKSLKRLYLGSNLLTTLPEGLAEANSLTNLVVTRNKMKELPSFIFRCNALEELDVQANELIELPTGMKDMRCLKICKFEMNPILSPPQDFRGSTWKWKEVQLYCIERERRKEEIGERLRLDFSDEFIVKPESIFPRAQDVLTEKNMWLKSSDGKFLDLLVDRYVNGPFYEYALSLENVIGKIQSTINSRMNQKRRLIIDEFMKVLEIAERFNIFPEDTFSAEIEAQLGLEDELVPCFAVNLTSIFESTSRNHSFTCDGSDLNDAHSCLSTKSSLSSSSMSLSDDENGEIFRELEDVDFDNAKCRLENEKLNTHLFIEQYIEKHGEWPAITEVVENLSSNFRTEFKFTRSELENAIQNYEGPYGKVGWLKAPFNFETMLFEGASENDVLFDRMSERLQYGITKKSPFLSPSNDSSHAHTLIVPKMILTEKEASQRRIEEEIMAKNLMMVEGNTVEWLNVNPGKARVRQVAQEVLDSIAKKAKSLKEEMKKAKESEIRVRQALHNVKMRKDAFEMNKQHHLHNFNSKKDSEEALLNAQERLVGCTREIQRLEALAEKSERKPRLKRVLKDIECLLVTEVKKIAAADLQEKFRLRAQQIEERRPWEHDFHRWLSEHPNPNLKEIPIDQEIELRSINDRFAFEDELEKIQDSFKT